MTNPWHHVGNHSKEEVTCRVCGELVDTSYYYTTSVGILGNALVSCESCARALAREVRSVMAKEREKRGFAKNKPPKSEEA